MKKIAYRRRINGNVVADHLNMSQLLKAKKRAKDVEK
jgi:hypothetical protein